MTDSSLTIDPNKKPTPSNPWKVFSITIIVLAAIALSIWIVKTYFFPNEFKPVQLSQKETQILNQKLDQLNLPAIDKNGNSTTTQTLEPEAYSETDATREVTFSEREINALVAHNTDMADKLAIDFSNNLASAKLLVPLDPDMPLFGGRTLNLKAGIELAYYDGRPVVKLRGVSAWGVPVPNAWLGNLKNIDLINEFGEGGGFWQAFADGIDFIRVEDGKLLIKLKE